MLVIVDLEATSGPSLSAVLICALIAVITKLRLAESRTSASYVPRMNSHAAIASRSGKWRITRSSQVDKAESIRSCKVLTAQLTAGLFS